jgi:hypothetical protein
LRSRAEPIAAEAKRSNAGRISGAELRNAMSNKPKFRIAIVQSTGRAAGWFLNACNQAHAGALPEMITKNKSLVIA